MRGMEWDPAHGFYCRDCGGVEADLLAGGECRCRTCGRTSVPTIGRWGTRVAWSTVGVLAMFAAVVAVELTAAWAYATATGAAWVRSFSLLTFVTGFAALVVAGIGAAPGRLALGNQRLDRMVWAGPIQNPVIMGTLSAESKARDAGEPGMAGILLTFGLGVSLILIAFALTRV